MIDLGRSKHHTEEGLLLGQFQKERATDYGTLQRRKEWCGGTTASWPLDCDFPLLCWRSDNSNPASTPPPPTGAPTSVLTKHLRPAVSKNSCCLQCLQKGGKALLCSSLPSVTTPSIPVRALGTALAPVHSTLAHTSIATSKSHSFYPIFWLYSGFSIAWLDLATVASPLSIMESSRCSTCLY